MPVQSSLWFDEILELESGRAMKVQIENLIETFDSEYQRIEIYKTKPFGKMLVLDGVIMCTDFDEHAYHEMIVHVPMCVHPNPESVLVIGGGDGGTLRELLRHKSVKRADICEIDKDVIRLCKKHFPALACSYDDPRVTVYAEDGAKFVKDRKNTYDVICVDSSDPIGFCKVLFSEEFYVSLWDSLKESGIAVTQSESYYYHLDLIQTITGYAKKYFKQPAYYFTVIPTYPSGIIGFTFCSKKYHHINDYDEKRAAAVQPSLKYYNPGIHRAAFQLPTFVRDAIKL
ncbi:MAG: polyamine aminopropyltransferase [Spirochaetes bacterium]|jgi:spermidine synthase|nr:polyamine aminopropyltransferase [Spirochaetota bacterium]